MNHVRLLQFIISCQTNYDNFLIFRYLTTLVCSSIATLPVPYISYKIHLIYSLSRCVCMCVYVQV